MKKRKNLQRIVSVVLVIVLAVSAGTEARAYELQNRAAQKENLREIVPVVSKRENFGVTGFNDYRAVTAEEDGFVVVGIEVSPLKDGSAAIAKYDRNGDLLWKKKFGGGASDWYNGVAVVRDGYVAVGFAESSSFGKGDLKEVEGKGSEDAIIVKYDKAGNVLWRKNFGSSGIERYHGVAASEDGYVAVGESYASDEATSDGNAVIVKYDTDGNVLWEKSFGASGRNCYYGVTASEDGYAVVGWSNASRLGTEDWAGIEGEGAIIVKYDRDGKLLWKKNDGGGNIYKAVTALEDGYIAVGRCYDKVEGVSDEDAIIVKYDRNGNVLWKKTFDAGQSEDYTAVTALKDGYVAVGSSGNWNSYSNSMAAVIVKYGTDGEMLWEKTFASGASNFFDGVAALEDSYIAVGEAYAVGFGTGEWEGIESKGGTSDAIIVKYDKAFQEIPTGISLNNKTLNLKKDEQMQLSYTLTPSGSTTGVSFSSSNTSVATVDRDSGLITAAGSGTALIKASTEEGLEASCVVTVEQEALDNSSVSSDFTYNTLDDDTLKITGYKGTATDITIPSAIDGKQVTGIGAWAFGNSIASVNLPDSISSIDDWAFHQGENITGINVSSGNKIYSSYDGCLYTKDGSKLLRCPGGKNSVNLRSSLKIIAGYAFYGCANIKTIDLPEGLIKIAGYGFADFISLRSISLPKGVTEIGYHAFSDCSSLERIEIPDSVTHIGDGIFSDCSSLITIDLDKNNQNYILENGVLFNKDKTNLLCCPAKKSGIVIIPGSVTEISSWAFSGCMSVTGIEIPNSVKSIGNDAFSDCRGLVGIEIPDSVTNIGYSAFKNCSSLVKMVIPDGMTNIESDMFSDCISLASIEIPDSVTNIEGFAFSNCSSLRDVYYTGSSSQWAKISVGRENKNLTNATIHYNSQHMPSEIVPVSISLSDQTVSLTAGGRKQLTYTLFPSAATAAVTYTSSNPAVVTVGRTSGLVTAVGNGTAVITVSTDSGLQAFCTVVVRTPSDNRPTSLTLSSKALTLKKGNSKKLTYTLTPSGISAAVTFTSSNPSVATVDRNGIVTAKKKGTATITAKASGVAASCKVTVTEEPRLKTPSLTIKLNSANGVKLSWKKVSGAQGYYVYRATSKNGSYKKIKKVKGTSYVNNKLKSGKTYYYKVAAYKGSTLGAKSKVKSKKIIGPLKAPKMKIIGDRERFTISWNNVKGASKIEILLKEGNGNFKIWKTVSAKKRKVSYSNNLLNKGVAYQFALRASYTVDGTSIKSINSKAYSISR